MLKLLFGIILFLLLLLLAGAAGIGLLRTLFGGIKSPPPTIQRNKPALFQPRIKIKFSVIKKVNMWNYEEIKEDKSKMMEN